jgi:predicted CoA-binding protein
MDRDSKKTVGKASGDLIEKILARARRIAVVGLSSDPLRPSNEVSSYMADQGYEIVPINPNEREVLGRRSYARLEDVPEPVDIVNVFRRSEFVPAIAEAAIRIKAPVLWLQEGVTHPEAEHRARAAGLEVVADRCILKEHRRVQRYRR